MPRVPQCCLMALCLAGCLLLLPQRCAGQGIAYDYDSTAMPEYDYNATFEYSFYSNSSHEELEKFIKAKDINNEDTMTTVLPISDKSQASRTVSSSVLLTVVLTAQQMLRFL